MRPDRKSVEECWAWHLLFGGIKEPDSLDFLWSYGDLSPAHIVGYILYFPMFFLTEVL